MRSTFIRAPSATIPPARCNVSPSRPFTRCAHRIVRDPDRQKVELALAKSESAAITSEDVSAFSRKEREPTPRPVNVPRPLADADIELAQIEQAKRDPQAFAPLYERYADMVWRFALSRLGDRERAADATSQAFSRAITALPKYHPKRRGDSTSFRSWLMTIARNTVIDMVRKEKPTTTLEAPSAQPWLVDHRRSPEEAAIAAEERRRVQAALGELTTQQRKVVELQAAGMKGAEISEILGISVSAVRTTHFRAYARLREVLRETDGEGTS